MAFSPRIAYHVWDNADASAYWSPAATFTPAAGEMFLAIVYNQVTSGTPEIPSISDTGSHTWTQVDTVVSGQRRKTIWSAPDNGSTSSTTLSITTATGQIGSSIQIIACTGVDTATADGVVQHITASGSSTTPSLTLSAFGNSNNACVFAINYAGNNSPTSNNLTNATGFPQEDKGTLPSNSAQVGFQASQNLTPNFVFAGSAGWLAIGIELKLASAGTTLSAVYYRRLVAGIG